MKSPRSYQGFLPAYRYWLGVDSYRQVKSQHGFTALSHSLFVCFLKSIALLNYSTVFIKGAYCKHLTLKKQTITTSQNRLFRVTLAILCIKKLMNDMIIICWWLQKVFREEHFQTEEPDWFCISNYRLVCPVYTCYTHMHRKKFYHHCT